MLTLHLNAFQVRKNSETLEDSSTLSLSPGIWLFLSVYKYEMWRKWKTFFSRNKKRREITVKMTLLNLTYEMSTAEGGGKGRGRRKLK